MSNREALSDAAAGVNEGYRINQAEADLELGFLMGTAELITALTLQENESYSEVREAIATEIDKRAARSTYAVHPANKKDNSRDLEPLGRRGPFFGHPDYGLIAFAQGPFAMESVPGVPAGFLRLKGAEVFIQYDQLVVVGTPDEGTEQGMRHVCEAMGCAEGRHVLIRVRLDSPECFR